MVKRTKVMAGLMAASLLLAWALPQAGVSREWRAWIAGGNTGSAPTHLVAAGDDNGV
jgi:hypothetical protein